MKIRKSNKMFFDVANINVAFWIPPLVGFFISLITSSSGVTGAFLLLPFQVSVLGFTNPAVSPTNQVFAAFATPMGIIRYLREGRMLFPLAWLMTFGIIPGLVIGTFLRLNYIHQPEHFKIFVGFVLLYIGIRVIIDILQKKTVCHTAESKFQAYIADSPFRDRKKTRKMPKSVVKSISKLKIEYVFFDETFVIPTIPMILISFASGIIGGIYGIGGGALVASACCSRFKLPVYTIAGPVLLTTLISSLFGVFCYEYMASFYHGLVVAPDWKLGLMFGLGGLFGVYLGSRLQKYIPAKIIKWILAVSILFISVKYINLSYIFSQIF